MDIEQLQIYGKEQGHDFIPICEHCNAEGAEIPFDNILDRITGSDPKRDELFFGSSREVSEL